MGAEIAAAYAEALSTRERASPATITYLWSAETLYQNLLTYDLGAHVNFGAQGGATALDHFGMWGRWLVVGQELSWISADGQAALVKLTYERAAADLLSVTLERVTSFTGAATASLMAAHTVDTQPARLLVALVSLRALQSVVSVTYGGQQFTRVQSAQAGAGNAPRAELWSLLAPNIGTENVTVSLTGADFVEVCVLGFYHAQQVSPLRGSAAGSGLASPASIYPLNNALDDLMFDGLAYSGAAAAPLGTGHSPLVSLSSDGSWKLSVGQKAGGGSSSLAWSTSGAWAQVGFAVRSVSGG